VAVNVEEELDATPFPILMRMPSGKAEHFDLRWHQDGTWDRRAPRLAVPQQPLMRPADVRVTGHASTGWRVSGPLSGAGADTGTARMQPTGRPYNELVATFEANGSILGRLLVEGR
jgi:hypothetical protein